MRSRKNSLILSRLWRELVNPEKRMELEGPFLSRHLPSPEGSLILDSCLGSGATSVYLLQNGYRVLSNEIDEGMLKEACKYAVERGVSLDTSSLDWRNLSGKFPHPFAEAVLCMGNSLTYLFEKEEQVAALKNFHAILKDRGALIADMRNYPRMLRERERILNNPEAFREFNRHVYCGTDAVPITPLVLEEKEVVLAYSNLQRQESGLLRLYPFGVGEFAGLLLQAGFSKISVFSDYRQGIEENACFFQFVCEK
ncbi:class I SAM-dependent methyltransferase [Candidatus Micrarchaeota archaeon]|nr:class I SAM-dependent methyltransferase [Candidatus Micrarchaeota archaeon]